MFYDLHFDCLAMCSKAWPKMFHQRLTNIFLPAMFVQQCSNCLTNNTCPTEFFKQCLTLTNNVLKCLTNIFLPAMFDQQCSSMFDQQHLRNSVLPATVDLNQQCSQMFDQHCLTLNHNLLKCLTNIFYQQCLTNNVSNVWPTTFV